jgi:alpha 1,2-mannosyltransferase
MPYSLAPHYPSALGGTLPNNKDYRGHTFCGHTMLQYGLSPAEWEPLLPQLDVGFTLPPHAPPLFAHANLLKHSGYNNRRGNTFRELKRPRDDRLVLPSTSSAFSLSHAPLFTIRQTGLPIRGICADVWDAKGSARERAEDAEVGAYEEGAVEVLPWTTAFGGVGRDLEEMYYDEGGVGGGW